MDTAGTRPWSGWMRDWRARRDLAERTRAYVLAISQDPSAEDAQWLATHATGGDVDHAKWELRYARRALGLISAERDALDDRTASLVARDLALALARDPAVASGKLRVAERQLNARLRAYAEALANREGAGSGWHLGRTLLRFCGRSDGTAAELVAHAGDILGRYLEQASVALRESFGAADLPENTRPSAAAGGALGRG